MRSSVVFIGGLVLLMFGKYTGDADATYGGAMLFALGLVSMFFGFLDGRED